jgi:hypothetical protein
VTGCDVIETLGPVKLVSETNPRSSHPFGSLAKIRQSSAYRTLAHDLACNPLGVGSPVFFARCPPDFSRGASVHRSDAEPDCEIGPS